MISSKTRRLTVNETVWMLISGTLGADGVNGTGDASFCSTISAKKKNKTKQFLEKKIERFTIRIEVAVIQRCLRLVLKVVIVDDSPSLFVFDTCVYTPVCVSSVNRAHCCDSVRVIYIIRSVVHWISSCRQGKRKKMLRRTPLVVILGSTATGKTKLSIELAKRFNGEIISADSMQIYKGLDISTAKATLAERSEAVHHMLDVCDMKTKTFTVVDFRDAALPKIDQLLGDDVKPIIVGGTTYYIETLLWKVLISSNERAADSRNESTTSGETYSSMSLEEIVKKLKIDDFNPDDPLAYHNLLTKLDPTTAQSLHPNNVRKVRRALEVYAETGRPMSEVLTEQKSQKGSSYLGGPLRFEHVILLWIKSDQEKLNARIDRRIDSMVNEGMLFEVRECYNLLKSDGIDPTRGIMQAIGFKEFLPYLETYTDESFDSEITDFIREHGGLTGQKKFIIKNRITDALKLLEDCLDDLRLHTKQYSKRQIKWIRNRLVSTKGRYVPPVYELDSTDAETNWHANVFSKAEHIIQSYIDNVEPNVAAAEKNEHPTANLNMHVTHFCDVCNRRIVGDLDFNIHLRSATHWKAMERQRRLAAAASAAAAASTKLSKRSIFTQIIHNIWDYCNRTRIRIVSFFWK